VGVGIRDALEKKNRRAKSDQPMREILPLWILGVGGRGLKLDFFFSLCCSFACLVVDG
jgi:hypothetical protein